MREGQKRTFSIIANIRFVKATAEDGDSLAQPSLLTPER
jgi:hypothetical protein